MPHGHPKPLAMSHPKPLATGHPKALPKMTLSRGHCFIGCGLSKLWCAQSVPLPLLSHIRRDFHDKNLNLKKIVKAEKGKINTPPPPTALVPAATQTWSY
jgi:hypothetical protein